MKLFTFRGGIHPPYQKELAMERETVRPDLPKTVTVPLAQHIGAPCTPAVENGAPVKAGQVIGEAKGFVSSPVHAPLSGKVKKIERALHPLGQKVLSVIIESDGSDEHEYMKPLGDDPEKMEPSALNERVLQAGIVGMGGATFPAHVKFSPPKDKPIDTLIINGCECEPYLTADYRLMLERTDDLILGARMIGRILNVKRIIIGIEKNKPAAVEKLEAADAPGIETLVTETKYPEGAEKMLIRALTDREVPSGGLPMDVGVVVSNVGTAVALCEAVRDGKPLIERVVTVTGDGVRDPGNFMVKIGTSFEEVIGYAGGTAGETGKVVMGGPMMGLAQQNTGVPVIKGTSGILVLKKTADMTQEHMPCIKCSFCVQACPVHLMPSTLSIIAEAEKWERALDYGVNDCIECGCCTYVCPAKRPIVQLIKTMKVKLREIQGRKKE